MEEDVKVKAEDSLCGCRSVIKCLQTLKVYTNGSINTTELMLLCHLTLSKHPIRYADLALALDTTVTTIARTCKRLGQQMVYNNKRQWVDIGLGLIRALPNPENTRELTAELTNAGKAVMREALDP